MERINVIKTLYNHLSNNAIKAIKRVYLYKIMIILLGLIYPFLFKYLIDSVLIEGNIQDLIPILMSYFLFYFVTIFVEKGLVSNVTLLKNKFSFDIKTKLWEQYTLMPYYEYEKIDNSELKMIIDNDVNSINKFMLDQMIEFYIALLSTIAYVIAIFIIDYRIAILSCSMIPVIIILGMIIGTSSNRMNEKMRCANKDYNSWFLNTLNSLTYIKVLCLEKRKLLEFVKKRHEIVRLEVERNIKAFFPKDVILVYINDIFISKIFIYILGGWIALKYPVKVGTVLIFIKYYQSLFQNIQLAIKKEINFKAMLPSIVRVIDMVNMEFHLKAGKMIYSIKESRAETIMELSNVSFTYPCSENRVIRNLSLDVKRGEYLAIVGKSGSGKTSLVKLLLNLYVPENGNIYYNNVNINCLEPSYMYSKVTAIMQDYQHFNHTIMESLLLANPNATIEELDYVCKKVGIYEFICSTEKKYQTVIGEKGLKLSGGQKQLLAIAQVLLKKPEIIIFDETTSSLDYLSEKQVRYVLNKVIEESNITLIVVAHRLSTIINADRVAIIKKGEVECIGTHDELFESSYEYNELFGNQY